jgi:hypothetical protein
VVGSGSGKFMFYSIDASNNRERTLQKNQFKLVHTLCSELSKKEVVALALSPSEDKLCALTADGQLLSIPLAVSLSMLPTSLTADSVKYSVASFHAPRAIVGMLFIHTCVCYIHLHKLYFYT